VVKVECRINIFSGTKQRTFLHMPKCTASEPWFNEAEVIVNIGRRGQNIAYGQNDC
jgi:hypothetical protein